MNDEQKKSYYRGIIENKKAHISSLKTLINDMEFDIRECEYKIKTLNQSQQKHATQELGSEDKPERGQAMGYPEEDSLRQ